MDDLDLLRVICLFVPQSKVTRPAPLEDEHDWDYPLGVVELEAWLVWLSEMSRLEMAELPRCYKSRSHKTVRSHIDSSTSCDSF